MFTIGLAIIEAFTDTPFCELYIGTFILDLGLYALIGALVIAKNG